MRWRDAAGLAVTSVRRRAGRSVLTVLAVALATTLLTALVTIAGTARTKVLTELSKGGPLAGIKVSAAEPDLSQLDNDNARPGPRRDLDDGARRRIADLPDVRTVVPIVAAQMMVVPPDPPARTEVLETLPPVRPKVPRNGTTTSTAPSPIIRPLRPTGPFTETMVGIDLTSAEQLPITIVSGRLPDRGSLTEVAVTGGYLERLGLTKEHAPAVIGTELFLGAPRAFDVGRIRFRSRWVRATVVGVVAQEAGPGQFVVSVEQARLARQWTSAGGDGGGRLEIPTSPYTGLFVITRGLDAVPQVRSQITDIGYATTAPENLVASVQRYLRVVEIVLAAIGLIALVIASLGITNALLAAVRERKREIGVLKAIGARDRDVARVFLLEAGALGLVGGVLGTAGGWLAAVAVSAVVNSYLADQGLGAVQLGFPMSVVLGSVCGAAVLAVAAGTLPARRAAALPAREAMEAA
ncbi:MAG: ABC transporter permease [Actinobacteria bacterium]|nr:ABC transporter permease [Actinomycetota bacterium]